MKISSEIVGLASFYSIIDVKQSKFEYRERKGKAGKKIKNRALTRCKRYTGRKNI